MSELRHFLEIDDLSPDEVRDVVRRASVVEPPSVLSNQGAALLFEKPSGRTRNSMERAVCQLGGHPTTIGPDEVGIDVRETAEDVAKMLGCFHAIIAARVFQHSKLERMAAVSAVPVVNLLSDDGHPIQALADLCTLAQRFGQLDGLRVAYVGDANNVAYSLGLALNAVGAELVVSHPEGYGFSDHQRAGLEAYGGLPTISAEPALAVAGADAVYTDAWYSMGQEEEKAARSEIFPPWRVDEALMASAKRDAIFLHCLPAHRGDEVVDAVLDGPQSWVWQQATNRMHSARALIWFLMDAAASARLGR